MTHHLSWIETRLTPLLDALETGGRPSGGVGEIERGIPSISGEHFNWSGEFDFSSLKYIPEKYFSTLQNGRLRKGDILIVKDGATTAKCAYVDETFPFEEAAINEHVFLVRADPKILDNRFLFGLLRSAYGRNQILRSYRGAAIGGIPRGFTDQIRIPLPTLPEQQRIVDMLQQAEEVAKAKRSVSDQIDQLMRTLYWEHFGAWYTVDGLRDPVRISEYVADSQYGVSEAMEEYGSHAVLRMNSITSSGWLSLSDLKYANLSKKDAENTTLLSGDLLFNRTNSKELVGKCAIWRDTKGVFSFASYLIRLRLKEGMLPEYLWATLNSTYGKYRLMNAAKQAVSMSNVSPTDLGRITVPLPPLALQEKFVLLVRQIEILREEMLGKLELFHELQALVTGQALLGDITSSWREQHSEEIMNAVNARNEALRARGARIHTSVVEIPLPEIGIAHSSDHIRTARRWLIEELSEFQGFVLDAIEEWPGTLLADNASDLEEFCQLWPIEHERNMHDRAKRALEQLAALSLIAKVALPNDNGDFVVGYRRLRAEEKSRLNDIALLQASLESFRHEAGTAL